MSESAPSSLDMSSNIFENLQSPVSYDAEIDKGWQLVSEKGDNPVGSILQVLHDIYWRAVADEIANALLAFDDYKTFCPEGLPKIGEDALESEYLQELVDLWDPLGLSNDKKKDLCETVTHNVKRRQDLSNDELVARSLLQACGLTDYDFVQEYRKPTFPSLGPAAQVDKRCPGVYHAVQCSECRFCIRTFHFYECKKYCEDQHPGGALISVRPLPSLGRHSSREVREFLHPEDFRTIDGCDVLCAQLYSVSPDRSVYEATKKVRDRRFLCARKQLSGGLFTGFNEDVRWKTGEDEIVALFLALAEEWRTTQSPIQAEAYNRELLQGYASAITQGMHFFFQDEIQMHLFLFARKLGKMQKLAYSRMSNNCQDFCNGLVTYKEVFIYPTFDAAMYPFLPVSLSLDIEKEPDDLCLGYLQSFVKPLQYPIPGFRSRRAMIGSAVTCYSASAQNDADLIDHVWSVRFGEDHEERFSFGFGLGQKIGDPYLLKDEEMSCSDRFAERMLPGQGRSKGCTLADHLLDCPVDNLSVLQTHLLRAQKYYYNTEGEFLSSPVDWVTNRLEILNRLRILNDFLAEIALQFQNSCKEVLSPGCTVKAVQKVWQPADTLFSRAWHGDRRVGGYLRPAPDIDFGSGEMNNWKAVGFFTLGLPLFETHRQMLDAPKLFATRLKTLASLLRARLAGKEEVWSPWKCCTCSDCKVYRLVHVCFRIDSNFISVVDSDGTKPVIQPGHPDYVSPLELLDALKDEEFWKDAVDECEYALENEMRRREVFELTWESTLLLCLKCILGSGSLQDVHDRLEYYKLVFQGGYIDAI
ncbi:hypothetical protein CNMCM5793_004723 [Aspergillus hiratsukae]|uniref:Uncharacterized protein n=1 Tax=Aspergillus hiratsukae TaxID=1194566 RepID=A0A8H6PFP7_9EURO|nr:hypothetical protein CNMCM5793_004723 [Aspergillus hiratsukae]KAF7170219.1 hypothetical protein CNMCM6106_004997 [Aspergillus hiratsukae]